MLKVNQEQDILILVQEYDKTRQFLEHQTKLGN